MNGSDFIPILVSRVVPDLEKLGGHENSFFKDLAQNHTLKRINFVTDKLI
jgi:hypothetical protein